MNIYQIIFKDGRTLVVRCKENLVALWNEKKGETVHVILKRDKMHIGYVCLENITCLLDLRVQKELEDEIQSELERQEDKKIKLVH